MTANEAKEALKYINLSSVHPFYSWEEMAEVRDIAINALEEVQKYRALGTVEELRDAMEKQRAKEPELYGDFEDGKLLCPNCEEDLMDLIDCGFNNCPYCGQALDWRREKTKE